MSSETQRPQHPNCLKCRHFKVSWDPRFPRACTLFGIKTAALPSQEVFRNTGIPCPAFEVKAKLK